MRQLTSLCLGRLTLTERVPVALRPGGRVVCVSLRVREVGARLRGVVLRRVVARARRLRLRRRAGSPRF